jgi:hypothetical protein
MIIGKVQRGRYNHTKKHRMVQGWGKTNKVYFNADTETFPVGCLGMYKGGKQDIGRLRHTMKDYGREHLTPIFKDIGIV